MKNIACACTLNGEEALKQRVPRTCMYGWSLTGISLAHRALDLLLLMRMHEGRSV